MLNMVYLSVRLYLACGGCHELWLGRDSSE